jgi:hypothetical protein
MGGRGGGAAVYPIALPAIAVNARCAPDRRLKADGRSLTACGEAAL